MNSLLLAAELLGSDNFGTREFFSTWEIAKGGKGENFMTLDLQEISKLIDSDPVGKTRFQKTHSEIMNRQDDVPCGRRLYELLYRSLPDGVGKAFTPAEGSSLMMRWK